MTPSPLFSERVLFSPGLPEKVNQLLQEAVSATHTDQALAEKLFLEAQQLDRSCLQTYFALYKFYFYQGRLPEAEQAVVSALEEASRQGNFPCDYLRLARQPETLDMTVNDITLFYLYSLKALAFMKLRRGQDAEARGILSSIRLLDPEDLCGASVIMCLAEALDEEAA